MATCQFQKRFPCNGNGNGNGGGNGNGDNGGNPIEAGFQAVVDNPDATEQARSVANALSNFVAGGGVLPLGFAILAVTMTTDELAASLAQMSGEVSTGVAPMGMQSMDAFLDTVLRAGRTSRIQIAAPIAAPRAQEVPIGLVRQDAFYPGKYGAKVSGTTTLQAPAPVAMIVAQPRNWDIWASGYGSRNVTDANARLGYQQRTSNNRGVAAGINFMPNESTDFGIALSFNTANFALGNGFGSGTSDTVFVALRGRAIAFGF